MTIGHGWADPFIAMTRDGWDTQVAIQSGKVMSIQKGKNDNGMVNVNIKADNTDYGISGWLNTKKEPVIWKIIQEAQNRNENVVLRTERQRLLPEDQRPDLSIVEIKKKNATKRIAVKITGVYLPNKSSWLLISQPYSDPEQDPEDTKKFLSYIDRTWQESNAINNSISESEITELFEGQVREDPVLVPQKGKAYDIAQNKLTMYFHALENVQKNSINADDEKIKKMALILCKLADKIQEKTVKVVNAGDYSHTRARFLLFRISETVYPINQDAFDNPKQWAQNVMSEVDKLLEWSLTE